MRFDERSGSASQLAITVTYALCRFFLLMSHWWLPLLFDIYGHLKSYIIYRRHSLDGRHRCSAVLRGWHLV